MILKMLIENKCCSSEFATEHGMSLYMETGNSRVLLDTGMSCAFMENAVKMGVELDRVEKVIVSHAHNDHCGGLPDFLRLNGKAHVYISDKSNEEYYFVTSSEKENISVPPEVFENYSGRIRYIDGFYKACENLFLVSGFTRRYKLVESSRHLFVKKGGRLLRDDFNHEMAVVVNNNGRLVILTGCSHNGVLNMIDTVRGFFPQTPIQAVIGGFHLMGPPVSETEGESEAEIMELGRRLKDYEMEGIYTCHCTGDRAFNILKKVLGDKIVYFSTGMEVIL